MFQTLRLSDFLIVHQVPFGIVIRIALCLMVSFCNLILPVAFLLGLMIGIGRLSEDSELTAMRSLGIGFKMLQRPLFLFAFAVSLLSFAISFEIGPWGERMMARSLYTVGSRRIAHAIQPKYFNSDFYDLMVYADDVNPVTGELKRVFLFDERDPHNPVAVAAKRGITVPVRADNDYSTRIMLQLYDGTIHKLKIFGGDADRMAFQKYSLYLKFDVSEVKEPDLPRMFSVETLINRIKTAEPGTKGRIDFPVELGKRIALSLSPFIYCLLGFSLGSAPVRGTKTFGVLMTFVTLFVFWEALMGAISFTYWFVPKVGDHVWLPLVTMQIPNLAVGLIALYAHRRMRANERGK